MLLGEEVQALFSAELWALLVTYHPRLVEGMTSADALTIVQKNMKAIKEIADQLRDHVRLLDNKDACVEYGATEITKEFINMSLRNAHILGYYFALSESDADSAKVKAHLATAHESVPIATTHYHLGLLFEQARGAGRDEALICGHYYEASKLKHEAARAALESLSHKGCSDACYHLALLLEGARGTARNASKIARYYYHAAIKGHVKAKESLIRLAARNWPEAQYFLALIYESGPESMRDLLAAIENYYRANLSGHIDSQVALIRLEKDFPYLAGVVLEKMEAFPYALACYKNAAKRGDTNAQFRYAFLLETKCTLVAGKSLTYKDIKEILACYERAANGGHIEAQYRLGLLHAIGPAIIKVTSHGEMLREICGFELTAEESADSQKKALLWLGKAAENGHTQAIAQLAVFTAGEMGAETSLAEMTAEEAIVEAEYQASLASPDENPIWREYQVSLLTTAFNQAKRAQLDAALLAAGTVAEEKIAGTTVLLYSRSDASSAEGKAEPKPKVEGLWQRSVAEEKSEMGRAVR